MSLNVILLARCEHNIFYALSFSESTLTDVLSRVILQHLLAGQFQFKCAHVFVIFALISTDIRRVAYINSSTTALQSVVALLKEGAVVCCHNLAHETLVMCREFQKRKREIVSSLSEADIELLLHSLYEGHCTLILAKQRKNQYFRGLRDEYRRCFGSSTSVRKAHDPGQDVYKCGRLFLHYNDAAFTKALDDQVAIPQNKKAKTYREGTKTAGQKYTSQTNNNASRVSEEKERYKEEVVNNIYESFRERYQFR